MENYGKKITEAVNADKRVNSPGTDSLFEIPESPLLSRQEAEDFYSLVAKLLF
jgi:hypothetical protein